jgi:hypothetical protein
LFPDNIQLKKNILAEERAAFLEKILLAQDEVSVVDINEFQPEKELEVEAKVSCEKVPQAIGNIGSAKGLAMEFVVTEISFSDGSIWKRK